MIKGGKYINKTQDHSAGMEQPGGGTQSAMNKTEGLSLFGFWGGTSLVTTLLCRNIFKAILLNKSAAHLYVW